MRFIKIQNLNKDSLNGCTNYVDNTTLISRHRKKSIRFPTKGTKGKREKGLDIICKTTESIVVSK